MIQKVERLYVNKLRIVQLYEADFNTMLKHLTRRRLRDILKNTVLMDINYLDPAKDNPLMTHK